VSPRGETSPRPCTVSISGLRPASPAGRIWPSSPPRSGWIPVGEIAILSGSGASASLACLCASWRSDRRGATSAHASICISSPCRVIDCRPALTAYPVAPASISSPPPADISRPRRLGQRLAARWCKVATPPLLHGSNAPCSSSQRPPIAASIAGCG
jgi:hypothetical protein